MIKDQLVVMESNIISGNFLNQSPVFDICILIHDIFFFFWFNNECLSDCCITDTF